MLYFDLNFSTHYCRDRLVGALFATCAMMGYAPLCHAQSSPANQTIAVTAIPTNKASTTPVQKPFNAEQAFEKAKSRIDDNMVNMSNLVEALANNLGQLHYLRTLCYSLDDQQWRKSASSMVDLEAPEDATRKRQLIRSFNAGFYEQKERFDACTGTVAVDVAALSENARRLSVMLGDPYREHDQ